MGIINFHTLDVNEQLKYVVKNIKTTKKAKSLYHEMLGKQVFSLADDAKVHVVVYFIIYNIETDAILLVRNIGAKLWLFPGGHLEKGENLTAAVKREMKEELDLELDCKDPPFLLTTTKPVSKKRNCQLHLDAWFLIKINNEVHLNIVKEEADQHIWLPVGINKVVISDYATKFALNLLG
ncbi:MAG: NUDIX domain-containing protein [bacterium]